MIQFTIENFLKLNVSANDFSSKIDMTEIKKVVGWMAPFSELPGVVAIVIICVAVVVVLGLTAIIYSICKPMVKKCCFPVVENLYQGN